MFTKLNYQVAFRKINRCRFDVLLNIIRNVGAFLRDELEVGGERKAAQRTLRCLYVGLGGDVFGEICRLLDTLFKIGSFVNESGDQPFERRVYAGQISLGHRQPENLCTCDEATAAGICCRCDFSDEAN